MQGYRFDGFHIDPASRVLSAADGSEIALTGKAFDVLLALVEQAPRMVGKDQLLAAVWAGRVVDENNLTQAISAIRKALGTGAGDHHYILTEARRGYRFVAAVERDVAPPPAMGAASATPAATHPRRGALVGMVLATLLLALVIGWQVRDRSPPGAVVVELPMLAILPFRPLPGSPPDELLELGLADTLIARLSRVQSLRVSSLASSQRVSATAPDALAAGHRLQARYVLEGATQHADGRLRINARLLEVASGRAVWAGTFDATPGEVFTLQDRIAAEVTTALAAQGDVRPPGRRSPCDGSDPEAYRAYLTGRHLISRPDAVRLPKAIAAFQRAIALDPTCARAYAGLAFAYRARVISGDLDPREMMPLAQAATTQALRLDPDLAEAHATRGFLLFWYDWNWSGAEAAFKRAIALNPSLSDAHLGYAHLLANLGRFEQSLLHARHARELDPLSPLINTLEAGFMTAAGQDAAAQAGLERALELEPDFWIALLVRGGLALDRGDENAARADFTRAVEQSHGNSLAVALLGVAQASAGDRVDAEATLADLQARSRAGYLPSTSLAALYVALDQPGQALDALERAREQRDVRVTFLGIDAQWNPLRPTPRFRALARGLGLSAAHASGRF
ncbi:hypothetical protein E4582_06020 [Luteimonas yindakuii]|uniref:Uncharacterized protein n=1 Tax=Luteimonas yindakuii TaxID=2565782 RepID=A0A4Z1RC44_9GAMM|nr:winged helix-turn-helix domain-containing protein [Luteimonas yindakuii]QCO68020.1 hypothetical protein E5843_10070 [Luteimonas yindakuii]TKS54368.1 hypothetical protein E4582_06020 [Luteimonas yindakuii]